MNWDDIMKIGLGHCGFDPILLNAMTFDEFNAAVKGRREMMEAEQREEWERIRWQTCILLQPHIKKGSKLTEQKLRRFPWEKNINVIGGPTAEEIKASRERIMKRDGKIR